MRGTGLGEVKLLSATLERHDKAISYVNFDEFRAEGISSRQGIEVKGRERRKKSNLSFLFYIYFIEFTAEVILYQSARD